MKQATALALLKQGHHVFLTGQAGSGKTYLLNQYIDHLHKHGISVAITASTGMAATHMNGTTIHSWAGIGIKEYFEPEDYTRLYRRDNVIERLRHTKVLIIDEVSMLHARQLDLVDEVLQKVRGDNRPFGGVQVVLSGDFFQLPPIGNKGETNKDKFAFMAQVWIKLATTQKDGAPLMKVCYLSEQFRQSPSQHGLGLNDILNQIRTQTVNQDAIDALIASKNNQVTLTRTRLYTHNVNVDKINQDELAAIDEPAHHFIAIKEGDKELITALQKNAKSSETLTLKVGAKVMFTKNNPTFDIYNGTMGEVVDFVVCDGDTLPKIKLNNDRMFVAEIDTWSVEDGEGVALASYSQLPLCLAWAITVHKSQGMTLDAAEIDLSKTFELGQGYVALSRIRSLEGLKLLGFNQKSLQLDSFAQVANQRFLALSEECQRWFSSLSHQQKKSRHHAFIKNNTSTAQTKEKLSTYEQTRQLVLEQKTPKAIAAARALSESTIVTHLIKLHQDNRLSLDQLAHCRPNDETVNAVQNALTQLGDDTPISTHKIYETLDKKLSHASIDLVRIFIGGQDD